MERDMEALLRGRAFMLTVRKTMMMLFALYLFGLHFRHPAPSVTAPPKSMSYQGDADFVDGPDGKTILEITPTQDCPRLGNGP